MSFLSRDEYQGVAGTQTYSITFPVLSGSHISVTVNGAAATFTLNSGNTQATITTPTIANGDDIVIKRTTPNTDAGRLVDFEDGSVLTESDLDTSFQQLLYIAQESQDEGTRSLQEKSDGSGTWDGEAKVLKNILDPVDAQDAVTKAFLDVSLIANGNLPTVTTGNNDSFLAVEAGAWAIQTKAEAKTLLDIDDLENNRAVVVATFNTASPTSDSTGNFETNASAKLGFTSSTAAVQGDPTSSITLDDVNEEIDLPAGTYEYDLSCTFGVGSGLGQDRTLAIALTNADGSTIYDSMVGGDRLTINRPSANDNYGTANLRGFITLASATSVCARAADETSSPSGGSVSLKKSHLTLRRIS